MFRRNSRFHHPNSSIPNRIKQRLPILEYFPKMEAGCNVFIFNNMDNFGVEMLRNEMASKLLSKHMDALKQDIADGIASQHSEEYKLQDR